MDIKKKITEQNNVSKTNFANGDNRIDLIGICTPHLIIPVFRGHRLIGHVILRLHLDDRIFIDWLLLDYYWVDYDTTAETEA